jgi:hypothetical protein
MVAEEAKPCICPLPWLFERNKIWKKEGNIPKITLVFEVYSILNTEVFNRFPNKINWPEFSRFKHFLAPPPPPNPGSAHGRVVSR